MMKGPRSIASNVGMTNPLENEQKHGIVVRIPAKAPLLNGSILVPLVVVPSGKTQSGENG